MEVCQQPDIVHSWFHPVLSAFIRSIRGFIFSFSGSISVYYRSTFLPEPAALLYHTSPLSAGIMQTPAIDSITGFTYPFVMNKIDLHIHTIASGHGIHTLNELVASAQEKKMEGIAITDHGPELQGSANDAYFSVLCHRVPPVINSIRIFKGIEANILDADGKTDIPQYLIPYFDIILAYLHPFTIYRNQGKDKNTSAIIRAFEKNPAIDILAHPLTGWFPVDIKAIVTEACSRGIVLELNESSFRYRNLDQHDIDDFISRTLELNGKFVVSSDAHVTDEVGTHEKTDEIIRKYGIPEQNIINKTMENTEAFIRARKTVKEKIV